MSKSWGDIADEESDHSEDLDADLITLAKLQIKEAPKPPSTVNKRPTVSLSRLQALKQVKPKEVEKQVAPRKPLYEGPPCYCGEPSKIDTVKKHGKHEPVGTEFVCCSTGACKYWFKTPVPENLPEGVCLCGKQAAVCIVKKPESQHCGKMMLSCAFFKCKFYSIVD